MAVGLYLKNRIRYTFSVGKEVDPSIRRDLIERMIKFNFNMEYSNPNILFLAVSIVDRFLAQYKFEDVKKLKDFLSLLLLTSFWIASDEIEGYSDVDDYVSVFEREQNVLLMRTKILETINTISFKTRFQFAQPLILINMKRLDNEEINKFRKAVFYFLLVSLLSYTCLQYSPSKIAASVVVVADASIGIEAWSVNLATYSGYGLNKLADCYNSIFNEFKLEKKNPGIATQNWRENDAVFVEQALHEITYNYSDCHNAEDYISLDEFKDNDNIVFVYNTDTDKIICYDRELLLRWFREVEPMAIWIGGNEMGYGGHPDLDYIVYPFPDGYLWVLKCVVDQIHRGAISVSVKRAMKNIPVGNTEGQMGVSMLHGQNPKDIYTCV